MLFFFFEISKVFERHSTNYLCFPEFYCMGGGRERRFCVGYGGERERGKEALLSLLHMQNKHRKKRILKRHFSSARAWHLFRYLNLRVATFGGRGPLLRGDAVATLVTTAYYCSMQQEQLQLQLQDRDARQ